MVPIVDQDQVVDFVARELEGTVVFVASEENGAPEVAWGDIFFFYDPDGITAPEKRLPYATVVVNDYPGFDELSELKRPGVFRVNAWVGKETFDRLVGTWDPSTIDHAALDRVIPHPVYGSQSWLSVLNPGPATEAVVEDLLVEAHARARKRYRKRQDTEPDKAG